MVEEIGDKRLYIKREREREKESVSVCVCLRALLQYKALGAVLYKWPYLGTGMLRPVCASSQYDQILLFSHII